METILPVVLGLALSATAGLRAFLPLFFVSALGYTGHLELAGPLEWMASPFTLLAFSVAVGAEVLADKIPLVDHAMDAVGTVVRPAAGAVAGASILSGADPLIACVFGVAAGGAVAGAAHASKASVRAGSTATTAGMANPGLSLVEDLAVLGVGGGAALLTAM